MGGSNKYIWKQDELLEWVHRASRRLVSVFLGGDLLLGLRLWLNSKPAGVRLHGNQVAGTLLFRSYISEVEADKSPYYHYLGGRNEKGPCTNGWCHSYWFNSLTATACHVVLRTPLTPDGGCN
jgi:hypothetical protein